jgi:hypothetical protein
MTHKRRRIVSGLLALMTILVLAQHRLSDGFIGQDDTPQLWEPVHHDSAVAATVHAARALDCPLVLSTDRSSAYRFTSAEDGVLFDLDADGDLDRVSWTEAASDVAFLALDHDGDRKITSGKELFGRHIVRGSWNGPSSLSRLAESAGDPPAGAIDSRHPLFSRLLLWTDTNHNGRSEPSELRPARDVLSAIGLGYSRHHRKDAHGNESHYRGFVHVRTQPGANGTVSAADEVARGRGMYDVCLVTRHAAVD